MISLTGWEKRLLITLFITLFLCFLTNPPAMAAFGPKIVDVTTKAFSVVWTTGGDYYSCGIKLYTNNNLNTERTDISESQKIVETSPGYPGEAGKAFRIAKVTVVGLDINTDYYFRVTENGSVLLGNYPTTVKTQELKGLNSNNPADNDIVSNDIVHKAIYQSDGTSPAIGALVLADIYHYNATNFDTGPTLSNYPISAWVGDCMTGDDSTEYNPNNISYKQYAALNMNNVFGIDQYPLSLQGDDPDTENINESEIIKFTIVHGSQSVSGSTGGDFFISFGRVKTVVKMNNEKITTAMVSASFNFTKGLNAFAFPFVIPDGYTTKDLLLDIDEADGIGANEASHVNLIYLWNNDKQKYEDPTFKTYNPFTQKYTVQNSFNIQAGQGCFIDMTVAMTGDVIFYGKPDAVSLRLRKGNNLITFSQLPAYYTTENVLLDVESVLGSGTVKAINNFDNKSKKWIDPTFRSYNPFTQKYTTYNIYYMQNFKFYFASIDTSLDITGWDPFSPVQ